MWQFSAEKRVPLKPLLAKAAEREIASIFVEGGAKVLGSFFDAKLVDKVYWFVAPTILGSARAMSAAALPALVAEGGGPADIARFGNALLAMGVERGDRVTIYMPMVPETAAISSPKTSSDSVWRNRESWPS